MRLGLIQQRQKINRSLSGKVTDSTLLIRFSQIIVLRTGQFPLTADMIPGIWNLTWKEKTWLRRIRKTCFQALGRQLP
jgi:hypothetical protein